MRSGENLYRCEFLSVTGTLGESQASMCTIHEKRYDGMAIRLINNNHRGKRDVIYAQCGKDSEREVLAILPMIGRGCSLQAG